MEQQLVNAWHKKGLHLAQDVVVRKSIGEKTSALPQSWELSSSTEKCGTFYEHTEVADMHLFTDCLKEMHEQHEEESTLKGTYR
ncbi:hypothetical protein TNCV_1847981 [Trichonephila clavipes]|nr:hypothetical protein TNCV_1847981 [Trichonephila clavipes]